MPTIKSKPEFVEIEPYGKVEVLVVPPMSPVTERRHYIKPSVVHPAKMSTMLCRELVRRYTHKGDTVLDPMAGIGTTLVESVLLDRNAIGVELEEKFVKIARKNTELLKKLKVSSRCHAKITRGDSRRLTKLLRAEVDTAVFSPPYETTAQECRRYTNYCSGGKTRYNPPKIDNVNINNLKYGKPDTVIFSPPYAATSRGSWEGQSIAKRDDKSARWVKEHTGQVGDYAFDKKNIGNLDYGKPDTVIFSPPYEKQITRGGTTGAYKAKYGYQQAENIGYSKNPKNIGNLPHGKVNSIITSPSYTGAVQHGGGLVMRGEFRVGESTKATYGSSKKNIGILDHGKVDSIITSPPYSGSYLGGGNADARKKRLAEAGYDSKAYFGGRARNTVLKHYTEVDSIVTSPPYEAQVSKKTKEMERLLRLYREGKLSGDMKQRVEEWVRNPDKNRGFLGFMEISYTKNVDTIVTSPPYEDALGRHHATSKLQKIKRDWGEYSTDSTNIGNQKGATYLSAMKEVYGQCYFALKPGGKMVLVLKCFVRHKKVMRLDLDTLKLCNAVGFRLADVKLFRLKQRSFWRILQLRRYGNEIKDKYLLDYEIVQIYTKPDSRSPAKEAESQPNAALQAAAGGDDGARRPTTANLTLARAGPKSKTR